MPVTQTQAKIIAGTILEFEDPDSPGVWLEIPEVATIGTLGEQGSFVEATTVDVGDNTRKYVPGLQDVAENTLTFNWIGNNPNQNTLSTWAKALRSVNMRVTMSNGVVITATVGLSGFQTTEITDANSISQASVTYRPSTAYTLAFPS